jgi:hypothetical protein
VKCDIAALCCVFMRCVGECPSTQQKTHQRKIKTVNNMLYNRDETTTQILKEAALELYTDNI